MPPFFVPQALDAISFVTKHEATRMETRSRQPNQEKASEETVRCMQYIHKYEHTGSLLYVFGVKVGLLHPQSQALLHLAR